MVGVRKCVSIQLDRIAVVVSKKDTEYRKMDTHAKVSIRKRMINAKKYNKRDHRSNNFKELRKHLHFDPFFGKL